MCTIHFDFSIEEVHYPEFESVMLDLESNFRTGITLQKARIQGGLVKYEGTYTNERLIEYNSLSELEDIGYLLSAIEALAVSNSSYFESKDERISIH